MIDLLQFSSTIGIKVWNKWELRHSSQEPPAGFFVFCTYRSTKRQRRWKIYNFLNCQKGYNLKKRQMFHHRVEDSLRDAKQLTFVRERQEYLQYP